jgi:hypothetical protein
MKDEAKWMMNNYLTPGKTMLDFDKYPYIDGLTTVKPEAVNEIH